MSVASARPQQYTLAEFGKSYDQDWSIEELRHTIDRLLAVVRSPLANAEEKAIARTQLAFYRDLLDTLDSRRKDGRQ